eukprot:CAMPEP_0171724746 /NCGR_PEP_ID=MMETSP0991-20121206/24562_1 /TAXON_ID=483369 /ORGANISM="non described non described, Strain CCMP2098" /LENGTH=73 /DNA_ID=CAMNT_0012317713 /DNA_START=356 /DNA_END=577 /DNA_ORIENTATION=+
MGACVGADVGSNVVVGTNEGSRVVLGTGVNDGVDDGVNDGAGDMATLKLPDVPTHESSASPLRPPTLHETSGS